MASFNRVTIMGHLGADPELRHTTSGQPVTTLSVATQHVFNDREGQKQDVTDWHRVVVWGRTAETCAQYLAKGRAVFVEGRLTTRHYDDAQGEKRYVTEIVAQSVQFLGAPPVAAGRDESAAVGPTPRPAPQGDASPRAVVKPPFRPRKTAVAAEQLPF
jgi:single-strand DNA-binding protein